MRKRTAEYLEVIARLSFEEDLYRLMQLQTPPMNRAALAKAYGCTAANISRTLNGERNYKLRTMAKIASALGALVHVRLIREGKEVTRIVDPAIARSLDDSPLNWRLDSGSGDDVLAYQVPSWNNASETDDSDALDLSV